MFKDFKLTFSKEVTSFVQSEYKQAVNILEYGSGGSTILGPSNRKNVIQPNQVPLGLLS